VYLPLDYGFQARFFLFGCQTISESGNIFLAQHTVVTLSESASNQSIIF